MTFDDRVLAVAKRGFTERQARFLTIVMLHAGVCVPRQYARFCGIVHGAKTRKFFAKLVRLGLASMYDCRHNRARIYHLNGRALYAAIGEAESRLRKPVICRHRPLARRVPVVPGTSRRFAPGVTSLDAADRRAVAVADVAQRSKQVAWNQLLTPLPEEKLDELRWFLRGDSHPSYNA